VTGLKCRMPSSMGRAVILKFALFALAVLRTTFGMTNGFKFVTFAGLSGSESKYCCQLFRSLAYVLHKCKALKILRILCMLETGQHTLSGNIVIAASVAGRVIFSSLVVPAAGFEYCNV